MRQSHLDNIFIERLWRTLKYECVYLHAWETGPQARAGVRKWMKFYKHRRPHKAFGGRLPAVVYSPLIETRQPDQQKQIRAQKRQILFKGWGAPYSAIPYFALKSLRQAIKPISDPLSLLRP